jgi:MoaA/NifB/PqqE/SkfB family radical SAM enzyme
VYTFEQLLDTQGGAAAVTKTPALLDETHSSRQDRFLELINSSCKPLDKLAAAYNAEVERYNVHVDPDGDIRLRLLSHRELREVGVDQPDGEIWHVERLLCHADWPVHDFVRRGIKARF